MKLNSAFSRYKKMLYSRYGKKIFDFIKNNAVLDIAILAAAITMIAVPPGMHYISYFDFKTLSCLFCVLAVVCAFKNINFFYVTAQKIVKLFKNTRMSVLALVYITFIGSMIIANDMALITFLPLSYLVLNSAKSNKYMAFTFIMQNIAANLGGMLTPFGNPQNLYLYTKFNIPNGEFVSIMFLPFIISIALITICCMFIKKEPLEVNNNITPLPLGKSILYCILFALSVAIVFRGIPYWVGLIVIPAVLFFVDKKALKMVDYPLLFTFCAFFIFSGNMSRIEWIKNIFDFLLDKSTLLFSILSCQIISNVPSAILLSQFTNNYRDLLIGVNIGGIGTIIASLASLITFSEYKKHNPDKSRSYIQMFSVINFTFLILITFLCVILRQ